MNHLNSELETLKADIIEMWNLVIIQLGKSHIALETFDKHLVNEIKANEKRVDAFELKINMDCENILALFNPLANDLRFVLAVLKINYNLERIGDYARSISRCIKDMETPFDQETLNELEITQLFATATNMLTAALEAFEQENNQTAISIFSKDEVLDSANKSANTRIAAIIQRKPEMVTNTLHLLSIIRKLERVGDHTKNIAEEIVFYIEAKVLRHKKKKQL